MRPLEEEEKALAVVLRSGWHSMTVEQAESNARQINDALVSMGFRVSNLVVASNHARTVWMKAARETRRAYARKQAEAFAPKRPEFDIFDGFDQVLKEMEERKPWEIR